MSHRFFNLRRFVRARDGASAVEFAMVLPLFVMMIFGVIELARLMYMGASVQWAVDRAARLAVIDSTVTAGDIEVAIAGHLTSAGSPAVSVTLGNEIRSGVDVITVGATYAHLVAAPLLPSFTINFDFESVVPTPD